MILKKIYDKYSQIKKENGVIGASVLQQPNNPKLVIVTDDFENFDTANNLFNSEELKNVMQNAGVKGKLKVWFGEVVEKTPF